MWGATLKLSHLDYTVEFQSTRPVWGATAWYLTKTDEDEISIHAPRVGRDIPRLADHDALRISIHAPRVGRDAGIHFEAGNLVTFQSTRPVWGATALIVTIVLLVATFQSTRPVWGATISCKRFLRSQESFQSTRPVWGATVVDGALQSGLDISIHAPRVGRDAYLGEYQQGQRDFNPRAPCGARPQAQRDGSRH